MFYNFRQSGVCNYRKHCKTHENVPKTLQNTLIMRVIDNHQRPSKVTLSHTRYRTPTRDCRSAEVVVATRSEESRPESRDARGPGVPSGTRRSSRPGPARCAGCRPGRWSGRAGAGWSSPEPELMFHNEKRMRVHSMQWTRIIKLIQFQ